jgi:hypothetical protein
VKRDRLSGSLRDVCAPAADHFSLERYHLLSLAARAPHYVVTPAWRRYERSSYARKV